MTDENDSSLDLEHVRTEMRSAVERIRKKASEPIQETDPETKHESETDTKVD